jgi:hypothetical protein
MQEKRGKMQCALDFTNLDKFYDHADAPGDCEIQYALQYRWKERRVSKGISVANEPFEAHSRRL